MIICAHGLQLCRTPVNSFKPVFAQSHTLAQICTMCGWRTGIREMIIPGLWPQQLTAGWRLKTVIACVSVHSPSQDITNHNFFSKKNIYIYMVCVVEIRLKTYLIRLRNGWINRTDLYPQLQPCISSPDRSSQSSNSTTTECPLLAMLMEVHWSYFRAIGPKLGSCEVFSGMMSIGDCLLPFAIG